MAANPHPTLVTMYGVLITEVKGGQLEFSIIMELMQYDLDKYITKNKNKIKLVEKLALLIDVCQGV